MKSTKKAILSLAVLLSAAALASCSGDSSAPNGGKRVSLSVSVPRPASSNIIQARLVPVRDAAGNTLDITVAQVVVSKIEFETENRDCKSSGPGNCHEFEAGPLLLNLPVNGGMLPLGTEEVPFTAITEIELNIERPDEDDARTTQFRAANPSLPRTASLHLVGTFNGQPFDVFLSPEAELELKFSPPITLADGLNLSIEINVTNWLRNTNGNFIDPRTLASDSNARSRVEANIQASFRAFRDSNRDGVGD